MPQWLAQLCTADCGISREGEEVPREKKREGERRGREGERQSGGGWREERKECTLHCGEHQPPQTPEVFLSLSLSSLSHLFTPSSLVSLTLNPLSHLSCVSLPLSLSLSLNPSSLVSLSPLSLASLSLSPSLSQLLSLLSLSSSLSLSLVSLSLSVVFGQLWVDIRLRVALALPLCWQACECGAECRMPLPPLHCWTFSYATLDSMQIVSCYSSTVILTYVVSTVSHRPTSSMVDVLQIGCLGYYNSPYLLH